MNLDHPVNENITSRYVRVTDGTDSVVMETGEALERAQALGLDLVIINNAESTPIAKIVDYGKYKYDLTKKAKEISKKNKQSRMVMKEIQLRVVTEKNDVAIKAKKIKEFLEEGNKVRVVVKFRGREVDHPDLGLALMSSLFEFVGPHKIDKESAMNGRDMVTILAPSK